MLEASRAEGGASSANDVRLLSAISLTNARQNRLFAKCRALSSAPLRGAILRRSPLTSKTKAEGAPPPMRLSSSF